MDILPRCIFSATVHAKRLLFPSVVNGCLRTPASVHLRTAPVESSTWNLTSSTVLLCLSSKLARSVISRRRHQQRREYKELITHFEVYEPTSHLQHPVVRKSRNIQSISSVKLYIMTNLQFLHHAMTQSRECPPRRPAAGAPAAIEGPELES